MTKREAIKGLDRLKTIIRKESNMQIALNMAIEALDQVCENDCDICKHCEETDGMNCTDRPKEHWTKYSDNIYNPSHYTDREIEAITYICDKLTAEQFVGFRIGNVIKYISRYRLKGRPAENLQKALVYLDWAIEELKKL